MAKLEYMQLPDYAIDDSNNKATNPTGCDSPLQRPIDSESSVSNSTERPGPSNQVRLRLDGNDNIGRPGPSSQARPYPTDPLSSKTPQSHSGRHRSDAPTPKSPARKAPRKQAKPKKRREDYTIPVGPFHRFDIYLN